MIENYSSRGVSLPNHSVVGFTVQKTVCDLFDVAVNNRAMKYFESNFDAEISERYAPHLKKAFKELGSIPKVCTTMVIPERIALRGQQLPAYIRGGVPNFTLANGKTVSIRTNINGVKVAPRILGQAGFERLNEYFEDTYGKEIRTQDDIKHLVIDHTEEVLPTFLDCLFDADYILWIREINGEILYDVISGDNFIDISFDKAKFTFTRYYSEWKESTTLKYEGISIAEIQVHQHRSFKFRFIMSNLLPFIVANKENNETFGMTAEIAICGEYDLEYPKKFNERYSPSMGRMLIPTLHNAFSNIGRPIQYTGKDSGERGGQSKCPYDFLLEGNKTLSLKTNTGKMVCPPEVGQPSSETALNYFGHFLDEGESVITERTFKKMVFKHISEMIPIYLDHLFDSDYLLRIRETPPKSGQYSYSIIEKGAGSDYVWAPGLFSFTKPSVDEWNESITVKYDGISLGEFQVHHHRNCFKFRFNYDNLLKIIDS